MSIHNDLTPRAPDFVLAGPKKKGAAIRQFLTYTTGRHVELADELIIDDLHMSVKKQGLGLYTLIVECLMSEIFRLR